MLHPKQHILYNNLKHLSNSSCHGLDFYSSGYIFCLKGKSVFGVTIFFFLQKFEVHVHAFSFVSVHWLQV